MNIFNEKNDYKIYKSGRLRADKIKYPDGIGCSIWIPLPRGNEECGLVWDFYDTDIDDLINIANQLKHAEAEIYEEN